MKKKIDITENEVFAGERKHRRVVGVLGDRVYYSDGGNHRRTCKLATFRAWVRRHSAVRVDRSVVPTL